MKNQSTLLVISMFIVCVTAGPTKIQAQNRASLGTAPVSHIGIVVTDLEASVRAAAEVFGVQAVIGTQRHSAPETGALAKSASGTLERQPYLRVNNLSRSIEELKSLGFVILGLDGLAEKTINEGINSFPTGPMAFVLGAEGPGLRDKTKLYCDMLIKVPSFHGEGSLNVSNAAIIALYDIRYGRRP